MVFNPSASSCLAIQICGDVLKARFIITKSIPPHMHLPSTISRLMDGRSIVMGDQLRRRVEDVRDPIEWQVESRIANDTVLDCILERVTFDV